MSFRSRFLPFSTHLSKCIAFIHLSKHISRCCVQTDSCAQRQKDHLYLMSLFKAFPEASSKLPLMFVGRNSVAYFCLIQYLARYMGCVGHDGLKCGPCGICLVKGALSRSSVSREEWGQSGWAGKESSSCQGMSRVVPLSTMS